MVRVAALKSRLCEMCPASARAQHIYLTMKNIQLRAENAENAPEWFELAPEFETHPRQLDLIDNSDTETLVPGKIIPAGNFRELRLQFYLDESQPTAEMVHSNNCGAAGWNCIVLADGRVEPLSFPEETAEVRIPLSDDAHGELLLLPETNVDLRFSLLPQQVFSSSGDEGLKIQNRLVGRLIVIREPSPDATTIPRN